MLPIAGFEYLDDSYLLLVSDVIQAINKVSPNSLTINLVNELERKKIIKTILHTEEIGRIISAQLQGYNIPEFSHRITKHEALKLLKIANGSQEPKEIPKLPNQNRENKSNSLLLACIDTFKKGNHGDIPSSAAQLLNYCLEHKVQGYEELKKEHDRLEWKGDSLSLKYFRGAFRTFKDTKQDV